MTPPRLSPLDALLEAGARSAQRGAALLRSAGLPLAGTLLASGLGTALTGGAQIALQLTSVALLALSAAQVHRVLAPAQPPAASLAAGMALRIWLRYLLWLLTLVITLALGVAAPVTWLAEQAWSAGAPSEARLGAYLLAAFAVVAVGLYLNARLCLVLPAQALQRSSPLWLAWTHSRGNAAALLVLLMLPERLQWLLARGLGQGAAGKLASALLEVLLLVAIAALLSVAWSRLTEPGGPIRGLLSASWATVLLGLPILLSHAWSQAESHRSLRALRSATAALARSEVAMERQQEARRAVLAGERARGLQLYREALELHRAAENVSGEAWSLAHIAAVERELGNEPAARAALESALERARAARETGVEALVREALAESPPPP